MNGFLVGPFTAYVGSDRSDMPSPQEGISCLDVPEGREDDVVIISEIPSVNGTKASYDRDPVSSSSTKSMRCRRSPSVERFGSLPPLVSSEFFSYMFRLSMVLFRPVD